MKWVTTDHIHLDRVASLWLIRRFVDPSAQFTFVPWDQQATPPADAIPVAVEGAEFGPHDVAGTTFAKILRKYGLADPALAQMEAIVASGVAASRSRGQGRILADGAANESSSGPSATEGAGVMALSRGLMLRFPSDAEHAEYAMALYDALYLYCRANLEYQADPTLAQRHLVERTDTLRARLASVTARMTS